LNEDSLLNQTDLQEMINGVRDSTLAYTKCRDLFDDQEINVADIQMLRQCLLERSDTNLIQKPACDFQAGINNPTRSIKISIDSIHISEGYADIAMQNPNDEVIAFQFKISGLSIDSMKMIGLGDSGMVSLNHSSKGLVFGNLFKNQIGRSSTSNTFLRIYFDTITGTEVCISKIHAILNKANELIGKSAGPCKNVGSITFVKQKEGKPGLRLMPNPFSQSTRLFFPNAENTTYGLIIRDSNGKLVWQQWDLKGDFIEIQKGNLAPGIYFFQLAGKEVFSGKLVVE